MECLEDKRGLGEALSLPAATSRLSFTMKSPIRSSSTSERSSGPEKPLSSFLLCLSSSSSANSSSASLITCEMQVKVRYDKKSHLLLRNPRNIVQLLSAGWAQPVFPFYFLSSQLLLVVLRPAGDEWGEREVRLWSLASLLALIWQTGRPAGDEMRYYKRQSFVAGKSC